MHGQPHTITLYCDLARLLPQTDPWSRHVLMSHGTFLELLDLAARAQGVRADITLFPQPDLARDPLFAQVLARHTNRAAYDPARWVPQIAVEALRQAAGPDVTVGFVGADQPALAEQHRDGIHLLDTFPVALDRLGMLDRNVPPSGYALDV